MKISKKLFISKLISIFFKIGYFFKLKVILEIYFRKFIIRGNSSKIVLYLSPERSGYEIEVLKKNKISLLVLSKILTNEILIFCSNRKILQKGIKRIEFDQKKINFFFEIFYKINLSLIISPAYNYKYDNLFAKTFQSKAIKFLIFHRECYNFAENHIKSLKDLLKIEEYKPDKVLVHNSIYKNIFKKIPKGGHKNVDVVGPLRMQDLVKFKKKSKVKKILFLSFSPANAGGNPLKLSKIGHYGRLNENNIKNFEKIKFNNSSDAYHNYDQYYFAHKLYFELVNENPNIKFEIRLKFNNDFYRKMIKIFCKKICGKFPKNLKFDEGNLWNSINESYFVCGYGSTALLEAAILNVPSVQIATNDLLYGKKQSKNLRISNHLNSFFIVNTRKKLNMLFKNMVILKKKPKNFLLINRKAKQSFKNFVFDFKKNNKKKFLKVIKDML